MGDSSEFVIKTQIFITFSTTYFSSFVHINFKTGLKIDIVALVKSSIYPVIYFQFWTVINFPSKLYFSWSYYHFEGHSGVLLLWIDFSCDLCCNSIKWSLKVPLFKLSILVIVDVSDMCCINHHLTWFIYTSIKYSHTLR